LADHYRSVVDLFSNGKREVILQADGPTRERVRHRRPGT
jgi:hypothetical protein